MIEFIATICGISFGAIGTYLATAQHIKSLKQDFKLRLQEEMDKQAEARVKAYAAERDFNHLKNNQEQLKQSILLIQSEVDSIQDRQIEMSVIQRELHNIVQTFFRAVPHDKAV